MRKTQKCLFPFWREGRWTAGEAGKKRLREQAELPYMGLTLPLLAPPPQPPTLDAWETQNCLSLDLEEGLGATSHFPFCSSLPNCNLWWKWVSLPWYWWWDLGLSLCLCTSRPSPAPIPLPPPILTTKEREAFRQCKGNHSGRATEAQYDNIGTPS